MPGPLTKMRVESSPLLNGSPTSASVVDVPASKEAAAPPAYEPSANARMGTSKPVPVLAVRRCRPLLLIASFAACMFSSITILMALLPRHIGATESMRQELRQKLVETGATLYGVSSCAYTQKQLADLGTTEHFTQGLDYVDCEVEAAFCRQMNVTLYPTWQINGQLYPEYYSLEKLSEKLSGDDEDGLDLTKQPHSAIGWARRCFMIFRYTFSFGLLFLSWCVGWFFLLLLNARISKGRFEFLICFIAFPAAIMLSSITVLGTLPPFHIEFHATESVRQELRQKLVETGATLYGVSSCAYTQKQLADLGTTEHFTQGLDYVDCEVEAAFCRQMNVTLYPTWQINGQLYPEYYSLEKLSEKLSGDDEDGLDLTKQPHSAIGWARQSFKFFCYFFSFSLLVLSWASSWLAVLVLVIHGALPPLPPH